MLYLYVSMYVYFMCVCMHYICIYVTAPFARTYIRRGVVPFQCLDQYQEYPQE